MSSDDLRAAARDAISAADMRDEAEKLNVSTSPEDKARAALLTRKADRAAEAAEGGIRRDLGLSNQRGARIQDPEIYG